MFYFSAVEFKQTMQRPASITRWTSARQKYPILYTDLLGMDINIYHFGQLANFCDVHNWMPVLYCANPLS